MIGMSDKQVYEHFKETFSSKIEVQLLEVDDIGTEIGKARFLIFLLNSGLPQSTSSFYVSTHDRVK